MNGFKKLGAIIFLSAYLIIGLTSFPCSSFAADPVLFKPQTGVPDSEFKQQTSIGIGTTGLDKNNETVMRSDLLARYITAFYNWGLSIVGVIAVLVLMAAGVIWLTSGGDSGKIGNAKKMIEGSLMGSALLVGSWFLLNTINPNLTKLPAIEMTPLINMSLAGLLDNAEKISFVCLPNRLTCANTVPPSLNIDIESCYKKLGPPTTNCAGTENPTRWCCGINSNTQAKADLFCANKDDGTACPINETAGVGTGYCANKKCSPCNYFGTQCKNNYECLSATLLQCGYGDGGGATYISVCNENYCANAPGAKNDSCGPNNEGKCLETSYFMCPESTQSLSGGTECDSGLKCCK